MRKRRVREWQEREREGGRKEEEEEEIPASYHQYE
jgi:hypothetical protein